MEIQANLVSQNQTLEEELTPSTASLVGTLNDNVRTTQWGGITGTLANQSDLNTALNGKQATIDSSHKLDYSLIANQPTIPTKTSDLTNDSGFLTQHQSLSGYATETWVEGKGYLTQHQSLANYYTKSQTDSALNGKLSTSHANDKAMFQSYGHCEIKEGDLKDVASSTNGLAASAYHSHGQYALDTDFDSHTGNTDLHKTLADRNAIAKVVPNTYNTDGYVLAPGVTPTPKVWKTDVSGAPAWRDDTANNATKLTSIREDWQTTSPVGLVENGNVETKYVIVSATGSNVETMVGNIPATSGEGKSYMMNARTVLYFLPKINGNRQYQCDSTFYAPTSAGTSGQVLKSNGSGAPTWVSSFPTNYLYLHNVCITTDDDMQIYLSIYSTDNSAWTSFSDVYNELATTYGANVNIYPSGNYHGILTNKYYNLLSIKATTYSSMSAINVSWIIGSTDTASSKSYVGANVTSVTDVVKQL